METSFEQQATRNKQQETTISLALSGGGARGIAHLGVLAALDELQIPVGRLSGVSSGAIAGAFYAAGFQPREILRLLLATNVVRLTRPVFSRLGLLGLEAVEQLLARHLGSHCTFADLRLPLTLVATDLIAGESVYFDSGPLLPPLLASSAVPILYRAVEYQGRQLVEADCLTTCPSSRCCPSRPPRRWWACIATRATARPASPRCAASSSAPCTWLSAPTPRPAKPSARCC